MKLVFAILSNDDSSSVSSSLNKAGFQVTKLATTGGFLRAGNTTLICGCQDEAKEEVIDIIKKHSSSRTEIVPNMAGSDFGHFVNFPMEVQVGGAVIFVVDVEQFIKV